MSSLSVNPPFPIFTDSDGAPLEAGYVWIGAANLNPQTNPINVFWDAALTVPASQPIRTLDGYPSRSGTPGRLYVNSDFSILVQNKNGVTQYSALSCTDRYSDVVVTGIAAADVSFTQDGTGAVASNVQAKLEEFVSITDFGAVSGQDSTVAIQAALDSGAENVYVPEGTFNVSSGLTISTKVRLYGVGTLNETVLQEATLLIDTVDGAEVDGLTFTGPETLSAWNTGGAVYRQAFKSFVKLDNCTNCVVRNIKSSGKRGTVWLLDSERCVVEDVVNEGFFGSYSGTSASDANWYFVNFVQGGFRNTVKTTKAFGGVGTVVLLGLDTSHNSVLDTQGQNIHDSLIYNSSGDASSFVGGASLSCAIGLLIRGSAHLATGFTIAESYNVGASLTGNGATPDAYNANGAGTTLVGNTFLNPQSGHAIQTASQDGLNPRDFIIANNNIVNHLAPNPAFSAISIAGVRGMKVEGNTVAGTTANIAIEMAGTSGNEMYGCVISKNTVLNGAIGVKLQYVDNSLIEGNVFSGLSGNAIFAQLSDTNFITGNVVQGASAINLSTVDPCLNNTVTNNRLSAYGSLSADRAVNVTAPPIEYETSTWTPAYGTTGVALGSVTYDAETQGFYTKIGSMVFITGFIRTDAVTVGGGTGDVIITGLPFTNSNNGTGVRTTVPVTNMSGFSPDYPSTSYLARNENYIRLRKRATSQGVDAPLAIADLEPGADSNALAFSCVYMTDS